MEKKEFTEFIKDTYLQRLSGKGIKELMKENSDKYSELDSDQISFLNFHEFLFKKYTPILESALRENDPIASKVIHMLSDAWIDGKTYYECSENVKLRIEVRRDDLDKMLRLFKENGIRPHLTKEETLH